jgi:hypothetical protein
MTIAQAREEWISPQTKVVTTNDTEKNIGDLQPGEKIKLHGKVKMLVSVKHRHDGELAWCNPVFEECD